ELLITRTGPLETSDWNLGCTMSCFQIGPYSVYRSLRTCQRECAGKRNRCDDGHSGSRLQGRLKSRCLLHPLNVVIRDCTFRESFTCVAERKEPGSHRFEKGWSREYLRKRPGLRRTPQAESRPTVHRGSDFRQYQIDMLVVHPEDRCIIFSNFV